MNAVLKLSYENTYGNLIWMPPYIYPISDLEWGIQCLEEKGYWVGNVPKMLICTFTKQYNLVINKLNK